MGPKTEHLVKFFQRYGGVVRFSTILKGGFHSDKLAALIREGTVEKVSHGLYRLAKLAPATHPDLVNVCLQAPKGVICLISALAFHDVTREIPQAVDLAISRGNRAPNIKYPPVRYYQFSSKTWQAGIEVHKIEGYTIRVYNLAKTLADCFKFRNKIGIDLARESMKEAITEKEVSPKEIMHYAKVCRVTNIIKPILESIV